MKFYVDQEYRCHISSDGTMPEAETDFFDGKCKAFVEGYRFVPAGERWTRPDGVVFTGEMIAPFVDSRILEGFQTVYEEAKAETKTALEALAARNADQAAALEAIYEGVCP